MWSGEHKDDKERLPVAVWQDPKQDTNSAAPASNTHKQAGPGRKSKLFLGIVGIDSQSKLGVSIQYLRCIYTVKV